MKKKKPKDKHVPVRTCIACRSKRPKHEMVRWILKDGKDLVIDLEGSGCGRGANMCPSLECFDSAVKSRAFNRVWKTSLDLSQVQEQRLKMEKVVLNNLR